RKTLRQLCLAAVLTAVNKTAIVQPNVRAASETTFQHQGVGITLDKEEKIMSRSHLILAASIITVLLASTASAQTFRGGITGSISDPSGAAIPGASVQLVSEGTGLSRNQETTSTGDFTFSDLPVGFYTITVSKQGFQTRKLEKVEVAVGKVTSLPVTLGVAQ